MRKTKIDSLSTFYWFANGLSGVKGICNGRPVMGLGEIIRGK